MSEVFRIIPLPHFLLLQGEKNAFMLPSSMLAQEQNESQEGGGFSASSGCLTMHWPLHPMEPSGHRGHV